MAKGTDMRYEQSEELLIRNEYANCTELTGDDNVGREHDNMLRVYRQSPCSILLQIRAFGPITESGMGKPRRMTANTSLGRKEVGLLIRHLETLWGQLEDDN